MKDDDGKIIKGTGQKFFMSHYLEICLAIHVIELIIYAWLARANFRRKLSCCTINHKHVAFLYFLVGIGMLLLLMN
jgi:hypothetical protein